MEAWSDDVLSKTQGYADEVKSIRNHFYSQEQPAFYGLGINELLTNGTRYLTKEKDLQNAESCFLTVLQRDPEPSHINTAVSNLITIYKQEGRTEEAFDILEKYHGVIDQDKYNNHLIDILDKTKRYDKLIKVLIKVIQNAGKSRPHRIKQLITCYIKTNSAPDAIKSLNKYKSSIDELSYNNLYISALELSGNFSKTEKFMNNLISRTYRVEHKLNYMGKLAVVYQKNERPKEAINIYEQWKKFYSANRSNITTSTAVAAISKLEITVDRNLCVLYYTSNKVEEAKALARNLLRKNSEDNIAQHILDDTYVSSENHIASISNYDDEHTYFEASDDSMPTLLE